MLNVFRISEMVGIAPVELLEIERYGADLAANKSLFMDALKEWQKEFQLTINDEDVVVAGYYEALIGGEYGEAFYIVQYQQALNWIHFDLSQSRVMLILSQFRRLFIQFAEKLGSHNLAKGLCHALDIGQSIVSLVYSVVEAIERMKLRSESEIRRIQKSYQLISAEIPPAILNAYMDHQRWKLVAFNLALGRPLDWEGFETSHLKCRLAHWLNDGGLELIPKEKQAIFFEAHERVHRFGQLAIAQAHSNHPEKILTILSDMEGASDIVAQILLDVIESEFIRIATADGLTGLPNRRSFDMDFDQDVAFAKRHGFWVGLILIDIDFFKQVNDKHGHAAGDFVLKEIAKLLKKSLRQEEKVYRWGGEEFAMVTLDSQPGGAEILAERARKLVEAHSFVLKDSTELKLTISCGSICFPPDCQQLKHEIFAMSDKQLYKAKEGGRNQVQHRII